MPSSTPHRPDNDDNLRGVDKYDTLPGHIDSDGDGVWEDGVWEDVPSHSGIQSPPVVALQNLDVPDVSEDMKLFFKIFFARTTNVKFAKDTQLTKVYNGNGCVSFELTSSCIIFGSTRSRAHRKGGMMGRTNKIVRKATPLAFSLRHRASSTRTRRIRPDLLHRHLSPSNITEKNGDDPVSNTASRKFMYVDSAGVLNITGCTFNVNPRRPYSYLY